MTQTSDSGRHPALVWAESGLMGLSGPEQGPPAPASGRWVERLDGVVNDIAELCGQALRTDAAGFLGERAALVGRGRRGSVSVGGACRMAAAADGVLAVSLARTSDAEAVPAWLEVGDLGGGDVWAVVAAAVRDKPVAELLERADLAGLGGGRGGPTAATVRALFAHRRRTGGTRPQAGAGRELAVGRAAVRVAARWLWIRGAEGRGAGPSRRRPVRLA